MNKQNAVSPQLGTCPESQLVKLAEKWLPAGTGVFNVNGLVVAFREAIKLVGLTDTLHNEPQPTKPACGLVDHIPGGGCADCRDAAKEPQPDYKHLLFNLLAVIHRDGGHYVAEHGVEKASADAEQLSSKRIVESEPIK